MLEEHVRRLDVEPVDRSTLIPGRVKMQNGFPNNTDGKFVRIENVTVDKEELIPEALTKQLR